MNESGTTASVTVVIPCRDHSEELKHCLQSLEPQVAGTRHHIVVVTGGRGPAAQETGRHRGVTFVCCERPLLPGAARNLGAAKADGDILAFIDADCIALRGWVNAARETLKRGARLAGGPILDRWPLHPVAAADNLLQFVDFGTRRPEGSVEHMPSCNLAIRRIDFEATGGFPEDVRSGQDVIFVRQALARWPRGLHYSRAMCVRHEGRRTLSALWKHQYRLGASRASLQLMTRPWHLRIGVSSLAVPAVAVRKLIYTVCSMTRRQPLELARLPLLLPMTVVGLTAYAIGFRDGCRSLRQRDVTPRWAANPHG